MSNGDGVSLEGTIASRRKERTMKLCMATISLGGTLVEKIEAVSGAGFEGIELFDEDVRRSGLSAAEIGLRCQDAGLDVESYQPFRQAEGVPDDEFADVVARFRDELTVARDLGTDTIVIVSNTDPDAIADRDRSAGQLAVLAAIAAECDMGLMFEALSWGTHISHLTDTWDVLDRAGLRRGALVLDTFHHLALGDGVADLAAIPAEAVGLVQVADAPRLDMDLLQWSRNHRCFPGEGELEPQGLTAAALEAGYDDVVSLEIFNPRYRELPPGQVAQHGADSLRGLLAELERTESASV